MIIRFTPAQLRTMADSQRELWQHVHVGPVTTRYHQEWERVAKQAADDAQVLEQRDDLVRPVCILNCDSPSYPPELNEYRQCWCASCKAHWQKEAK